MFSCLLDKFIHFFIKINSSVKCGCHWPIHPCTLCTGRSDPTAPRDLPDTMPVSETIGLVDPCFHPVLSFKEGNHHFISLQIF